MRIRFVHPLRRCRVTSRFGSLRSQLARLASVALLPEADMRALALAAVDLIRASNCDTREAVLARRLPAGLYTVSLENEGEGSGVGVGLLEVYRMRQP